MEEQYLGNYENRVLTLVRAQGEDLNLNQDLWRTLVQRKCVFAGEAGFKRGLKPGLQGEPVRRGPF